ncbi:MAG: hypothetical protein HEEMFOPI_01239 [Holosporales bacterium]
MIKILEEKMLELAKESKPPRVTFFKTKPGDYAFHDQFLYIPVPKIRFLIKDFKDIPLIELSMLITSPFNEIRLCALLLLILKVEKKIISDEDAFDFYLKNIQHVNNWNLVDASAHLILGKTLFKKDRSLLYSLSQSQNLWERRISIVATWYFIKKADLDDTFKLSQKLFNDPHDLIHKAVGWMLREAGKKDPQRLITFIKEDGHKMPRTMYRYAIEKIKNSI